MFNCKWSICTVLISSSFVLYVDGQAVRRDANRKEAPFLAALITKPEVNHVQGGCLVSKYYVLTLGSELKSSSKWNQFYIILYETRLFPRNRHRYEIEEVIFHPNLDARMDYNLALVKVLGVFEIGVPILIADEKPTALDYVTLYGYGLDDVEEGDMESFVKNLQDEGVEIKIQASRLRVDVTCPWEDHERFFCTKSGKNYPLVGDYGSPMTHLGKLVGLAYKNMEAQKTTINLAIAPFKNWILKNILVPDLTPVPENNIIITEKPVEIVTTGHASTNTAYSLLTTMFILATSIHWRVQVQTWL